MFIWTWVWNTQYPARWKCTHTSRWLITEYIQKQKGGTRCAEKLVSSPPSCSTADPWRFKSASSQHKWGNVLSVSSFLWTLIYSLRFLVTSPEKCCSWWIPFQQLDSFAADFNQACMYSPQTNISLLWFTFLLFPMLMWSVLVAEFVCDPSFSFWCTRPSREKWMWSQGWEFCPAQSGHKLCVFKQIHRFWLFWLAGVREKIK